ncbi:hypothetical protein [Streptomyces sp. NBC_00470]|uniref:hypothetical protein n=1 Tax=Streptomyces sp. NBC_00470 TaxID=2975753 RepID=UPI002F9160DB
MMPSKYVLPVEDFTVRPDGMHREPARWETWKEPAVDTPTAPTQITVYASYRTTALRKARHLLALLHARRAFYHPGSLPLTAADVIYSAARRDAAPLLDSELNRAAAAAVGRSCTERDARRHLHAGALADEERERHAERQALHPRRSRSRRRAAATAAAAAR